MPLSKDHLWTVDQVAQYLGVSRATVLRLHIRHSKVGRARRYDPKDVDAFVENAKNRPPLDTAPLKETA